MVRLCDECGAKRVSEGKSRPTSQIWGPNGTRWIKTTCVRCKKENEDCALYDVWILRDVSINAYLDGSN